VVTEITLPNSTCKMVMVCICPIPPVQRRRVKAPGTPKELRYYRRIRAGRKRYVRRNSHMAVRERNGARFHITGFTLVSGAEFGFYR
jgi:hypothetical protein